MRSSNNILVLTLVAMIAIAVVIAVGFYNAQLKIFQEKELHKLDCIASAVSYKIDGESHLDLWQRYPSTDSRDSVLSDPLYAQIKMQLEMARQMNGMSEDMYTMVYDSTRQEFVFGVNSGAPLWFDTYHDFPPQLADIYSEGGIIEFPYEDAQGTWLSAVSPITTANGELAGILQVDKRFDTFMVQARNEILTNLIIIIVFIGIIGALMFLSVKSILKRQEKLVVERREVEQMRQELVANVSHDLRTPLASIQGYLETLLMKKDDLDDERFERYLKTSLRSTEKLRNLVDELFELSKLEANERPLHVEPLAIDDLIHDIILNLKIDARDKGVTLDAILPKDLPQVKADIALVDRVLQNLISNSIKFCSEGDTIRVSADLKDEHVFVKVTDTGEGIDSNELPNIFNRFHRGDTKKAGTGLGLAIVKNVLELHDSEYHIESEKGKGTTFTFSLPVCTASQLEQAS